MTHIIVICTINQSIPTVEKIFFRTQFDIALDEAIEDLVGWEYCPSKDDLRERLKQRRSVDFNGKSASIFQVSKDDLGLI